MDRLYYIQLCSQINLIIHLFNYSLQGDQTNSELVQEVDVVQMQK